jgi:hypothetical protein
MYQSKIRPEFGREHAVQQSKHQRNSQNSRNSSGSSIPFLDSFVLTNKRVCTTLLVLLAACAVAFLSGCGGLTFNSASALKSSGNKSAAATLSAISCGTQSLTGAQSKACSVYLSGPATSAVTVSLTSTSASLTVPRTVVVPVGSTSTGFNAASAAVSQSVKVTITGKGGGVAKTAVIMLYPATTAAEPTLSKVSCGTQTLTGPTTKACSVYLSAAATNQTVVSLSSNNSALGVPASVTVPAGATTGGFAVTAAAVSSTQSATLTATANGVSQTAVFQLDGSSSTGSTQHHVQLTWAAPNASSDPLAGYRVYRSTAGVSSYQLLNATVDVNTSYTDSSVQSGTTYYYVVKSVDTKGVESAPSNSTTVTIP